MHSAAVGFQCPSCVSEGARQTRSGRTAYGGVRSSNPALTSQVLIAINVAVWIAILATGYRSSDLINRIALLPRGLCEAPDGNLYGPPEAVCDASAGLWFPGVADGALWQLVTSMFSHVEPWHLAVNMFALWFLGPQLELAIGRVRFLALYFVSGLGGSALVFLAAAEHSRTVGASGAIFGLMGALLVIALRVRGNVQDILMWIGLNFLVTVIWSSFISWQGHLGGFVSGVALMGVLVYAPKSRRTTWQVLGVLVIAALALGVIVARYLALS
jgi:membrane associated rhomboid family serine protease